MAGTNKPQRNERAVLPGYACYRIISDFHNTYWIDRAYVSSQRIYVSVGSRGEGRGGIRINRIASAVPAWNPIFVKKEGVARAAGGGVGLDPGAPRFEWGGEIPVGSRDEAGCNCIRGPRTTFRELHIDFEPTLSLRSCACVLCR